MVPDKEVQLEGVVESYAVDVVVSEDTVEPLPAIDVGSWVVLVSDSMGYASVELDISAAEIHLGYIKVKVFLPGG